MNKMTKLTAIGLLIGASALGGCAQIYTGAGQFEDFVTSPKTKATVAVLAQATVVFICDVSAFASVAGQIEVAAGAGQSTIGTNGKVLAASQSACTGLGGLVSGKTTAAPGAEVVTGASL